MKINLKTKPPPDPLPDTWFSNMLYGKKRKLGNAGNQQKAFLNQKSSQC